MKIHLQHIKANNKFHGKRTAFVDSGFVKTCDELVLGQYVLCLMCQKNQAAKPIL